jgi:hypothetical protein
LYVPERLRRFTESGTAIFKGWTQCNMPRNFSQAIMQQVR